MTTQKLAQTRTKIPLHAAEGQPSARKEKSVDKIRNASGARAQNYAQAILNKARAIFYRSRLYMCLMFFLAMGILS